MNLRLSIWVNSNVPLLELYGESGLTDGVTRPSLGQQRKLRPGEARNAGDADLVVADLYRRCALAIVGKLREDP